VTWGKVNVADALLCCVMFAKTDVAVAALAVTVVVAACEAHFAHVKVQNPVVRTVNVSSAVVIHVGTVGQYVVKTTTSSVTRAGEQVRTVVQTSVTVNVWLNEVMVVGTVEQV